MKKEKQDGREGETEEQPDKYPSRLRTYIYDYIYYLILKKIKYNFFFHLSKVNYRVTLRSYIYFKKLGMTSLIIWDEVYMKWP